MMAEKDEDFLDYLRRLKEIEKMMGKGGIAILYIPNASFTLGDQKPMYGGVLNQFTGDQTLDAAFGKNKYGVNPFASDQTLKNAYGVDSLLGDRNKMPAAYGLDRMLGNKLYKIEANKGLYGKLSEYSGQYKGKSGYGKGTGGSASKGKASYSSGKGSSGSSGGK